MKIRSIAIAFAALCAASVPAAVFAYTLPAGYAELEYIQSAGGSVNSAYADTLYTPTSDSVGFYFDFTYRGIPIGICNYDWYDNRTWYDFFFETKNEADQFYNDLVNDICGAGIPLTKDNLYGGMSNRKKPVSVFKWVSVDAPVKVKEVSPSNIETADHVGKYKVELGVMKKKGSS